MSDRRSPPRQNYHLLNRLFKRLTAKKQAFQREVSRAIDHMFQEFMDELVEELATDDSDSDSSIELVDVVQPSSAPIPQQPSNVNIPGPSTSGQSLLVRPKTTDDDDDDGSFNSDLDNSDYDEEPSSSATDASAEGEESEKNKANPLLILLEENLAEESEDGDEDFLAEADEEQGENADDGDDESEDVEPKQDMSPKSQSVPLSDAKSLDDKSEPQTEVAVTINGIKDSQAESSDAKKEGDLNTDLTNETATNVANGSQLKRSQPDCDEKTGQDEATTPNGAPKRAQGGFEDDEILLIDENSAQQPNVNKKIKLTDDCTLNGNSQNDPNGCLSEAPNGHQDPIQPTA